MVGGGDDLVVLGRASRLHDGDRTGLCARLHPVGEREQRLAGGHSPFGASRGLLGGALGRAHAALVAGADAHRLAVLHQHDGVGLGVSGHDPREAEVVPLFLGGLALGHHAPAVEGDVVGCLHEEAAADRADLEVVVEVGGRLDDAHCPSVLGSEPGQRVGVVFGRDHHFREHLPQRLHEPEVGRTVEGDDASEGRERLAVVRPDVHLDDVGPDGHPTGVGVLDDGAGGLVEGEHEPPRSIGVGQVVVRHLAATEDLAALPPAPASCLPVERALLVRVLAVAELEGPLERERDHVGQRG